MGGAIFNMQGEATVLDSTLAGNTALGGVDEVPDSGKGMGGAIFNLSGPLAVDDSTLVGNSADYDGAAIYDLVYDGQEKRTATAILRDTIVSGNTGPFELTANKSTYITPLQPPESAALIDVGQFDLAHSMHAPDEGQVIGLPRVDDPLLGPLADNGGPTKTMALSPASPAIDAGSAFGLETDQRGLPRPVDFPSLLNAGDGSDIGAFEVEPPDTTPPAFSGRAKADPSRFAINPKGSAETAVENAARRGVKKARWGTTFRYGLTEAARVLFTIELKTKRKGHRVRWRRVGAFAQSAVSGADAKPFSGRIGRKRLASGHYRARLKAIDAAGNASEEAFAAFTVVKR